MDIKKTGELISTIRKEKGLTQKELAAQLGVSDRAVSKWERGAGFPDVSLLAPLADALEIPVHCLLNGEYKQDETIVQNDHIVRDAINFVYLQGRKKIRKNIGTGIASIFLLWIAGLIVFGILDYSGAFLKDVCFEVTAAIYEDGEKVDETTVTVDGTLQRIGPKNFQGKFSIDCVPETTVEHTSGYIQWDHMEKGYQTISFYRIGLLNIHTGITPYLYISPDMREFALELEDGRIVATNRCIAELQSIKDCRYALSYESNPDLYPYFSYSYESAS